MFIKNAYKNLLEKVNYHNHLYYVKANPIISDAEYDKLYNSLLALEETFPELVAPTSPTQRVGSDLSGEQPTKRHNVPMLSLNKVANPAELRDFAYKLSGQIFSVEPKFDGLGFSALYENGLFKRALSRGDGREGQIITHAVKTIRSLPLEINYTDSLEIRGEIFIPRSTFEKINTEGKYSSARNLAAGTVKLLNCAEIFGRGLDAIIYTVFTEEKFQKESEQLEFLRELGFKVSEYRLFSSVEEVIEYCLELEKTRDNYPFDMDGAVVKVDDLSKRDELSFTATHPRFAIAFKFKTQSKSVVLREVNWQVSRNGVLTPVATVDPVVLDGAKITNATLHNVEFAKNFRIGSTVELVRSGEVIPKIIGTLVEGNGERIEPPCMCPDCGAPIEIKTPFAVCTGTDCLSQTMRRVIHYTQKNSLDIRGLGEVIVEDMVRTGKVKTPVDLYYLKEEDLLRLPGVADKKAENILAAIKKSKNPPLDRFLHGLGIPYTGVNTSRNLAKAFRSIHKIMEANYTQILVVDDIGETTANSIVGFFRNNRKLVEDLLEAGVAPQEEATPITSALAGKNFVITGTLSKPRNYFVQLIIDNGGKVSGGVSRKTDYLLAGKNVGATKTNKAKDIGVKVIAEADLFDMVG